MSKFLFAFFLFTTTAFAQNRAVITTTDFSTGSFSSLDVTTNTATNDILTVHSDTAIRTYKDKVYILNRFGQDNIIVLNSDNLSTPLTQYSTGNGTNPQDIVFASESKAYISRYGHTQALIVNPVTGDSLGTIDLSSFADADGFPEMSQLALYNNHLFIACQRLDQNGGFVPADFSVIAVVDITTDQLVDTDTTTAGIQGIVMTNKNPASASQQGSKWILSAVNTFTGTPDGGIEIIDLANLKSDGIAIDETALGGNVNALTMVSTNKGYVVISDASFANSVKGFDLTTKEVTTSLSNISGGFIPNLGSFGNSLYVLDQGSFTDPTSAGVKIYDTTTDQLAAGPISVGLPPSAIAFLGIASTLPTDFNGDGTIGFPDFLAFAGAFGKTSSDSDFDTKFDLDNNGAVDFLDFVTFAASFTSSE